MSYFSSSDSFAFALLRRLSDPKKRQEVLDSLEGEALEVGRQIVREKELQEKEPKREAVFA